MKIETVLALIDAEIAAAKLLRGAGGGSSRRLQAAGAVTALRALRAKLIEPRIFREQLVARDPIPATWSGPFTADD